MEEKKQILDYYARGGEYNRLSNGIGQLEFARTKELIQRYLPGEQVVIYDIGGGTGVYAFWLAEMGHQVHLMDITPENIQIAKKHAKEIKHHLVAMQVVDARDLPQADNSADMVLLLGPLYHLTECEERIRALREAYRVLKPGGVLLAAIISRYANLFFGLSSFGVQNELLAEPAFKTMMERELKDGQHFRPEAYPGFLARSFFQTPEALADEVRIAGFSDERILAIEGPGAIIQNFDEVWADKAKREMLLELTRQVEFAPSVMGVGPHIMAVGRKA